METKKTEKKRKFKLSPMKKIILGYIAIIFLGAFILTLPISSRDGIHTSFEDALFTSTSATCVTGLVVQDTATYWSLFGQIVILCLIEIGGLGFMTLAVCAMTFTKKNIGLQSRYTLLESINAPQMAGIVKMARFTIRGAFLIEGIGALLLATRFVPRFGVLKGLYFPYFTLFPHFATPALT
jgi:2a38: potassium uptake protein, TrkH family